MPALRATELHWIIRRAIEARQMLGDPMARKWTLLVKMLSPAVLTVRCRTMSQFWLAVFS